MLLLFSCRFAGYARIVLAIIAFWFMSTNYVIAGWCYIISALLDAVDGHAARAFNQSESTINIQSTIIFTIHSTLFIPHTIFIVWSMSINAVARAGKWYLSTHQYMYNLSIHIYTYLTYICMFRQMYLTYAYFARTLSYVSTIDIICYHHSLYSHV